MAVKIGHASIDENGKIAGGSAGDQSKKEVCTRNWYDKEWNILLRPKSPELAEKSAQFVEAAAANDAIGYDQNQRNTLYKQAKANNFDASKINVKCECDCSSLMHTAAIAGGARLNYGSNGFTTRNMGAEFADSGDYLLIKDAEYLKSDKKLKRGDILVKEGSHTVMVLSNGTASESSSAASSGSASSKVNAYAESIKNGQKWLNSYYGFFIKKTCGALLAQDGSFGKKTRAAAVAVWKDLCNRKYRTTLTPDNPNFYGSSKTAAKHVRISQGDTGTFVLILQLLLAAKKFYSGKMDAEFGSGTYAAVKAYKASRNLGSNGEVNENVWYELFN
jgi:hypothetical protein